MEKIVKVFLWVVVISALFYQFCIAYLVYYKRQDYNEEELKVQLLALHRRGVKITPALAAEVLKKIEQPLKKQRTIEVNF